MCFSITKYNTESTKTISTSFNFMSRQRRSPNVLEHLQRSPHNINKMPILHCKIKSNCFCRCSTRQNSIAYRLINCPNKNMETMKACSQIKSTSINCVTKSETCGSIFYILTIHKKCPLSNCNSQISSTKIFFVIIECMFCCICSKVRCLQN
jgi:hypothetical protein